MFHILYILAVNYNRKHLENSKLDWKNSWIFFLQNSGNPVSMMQLRTFTVPRTEEGQEIYWEQKRRAVL